MQNELAVTQYCYSEWPLHGKPASPAGILQLLDMLNNAQVVSEKNIITVVCKYVELLTSLIMCIMYNESFLKAMGVVVLGHSSASTLSLNTSRLRELWTSSSVSRQYGLHVLAWSKMW